MCGKIKERIDIAAMLNVHHLNFFKTFPLELLVNENEVINSFFKEFFRLSYF